MRSVMSSVRVGLSSVLAMLALCLGYDVAVCWTEGAPARAWGWWELSRMRLATFLALCVACLVGAAWLRWGWPLRTRARVGSAAALLFAVFLGNGRYIGSNDAAATRLIPFVALREGRLSFEGSNQVRLDPSALPYWFVQSGEHIVSKYPVATGLMAVPAYLPAVLGSYDPRREAVHELERIAAALLTLLGVACIFSIAQRWLPLSEALAITAVYALGTSVASILSKALWQHVGGALGFSLALLGLYGLRRSAGAALLTGLGLGLAVAARSSNVLPAAAVVLAMWFARDAKALAVAGLAAALPLAAQLGYAQHYFGSWLGTGYGAEASQGWTAPWLSGVLGLLISPGRGLFVYAPCLIFAASALWRGSDVLERRQSRMLLLGAVLLIALMGKWWCWWGGRSAGERMTSDVLPLWGVGLVLAAARFGAGSRWRGPFVVSCVYAVLVQSLVSVARPGPQTRALFVDVLSGAWDPRAYAPLSYLLDALSGS